MEEICIVIPAFNESKTIGRELTDINKIIAEYDFIKECIVVDDGSSDGTDEIAYKHNMKCLKNDCQRGYGASIKIAINYTSANLICVIDGDNTYSAYDIAYLYEVMNKNSYDLLIGVRPQQEFSFYQRIAKNFIKFYLKVIFKSDVHDINSGLFLAKKSIMNKYKNILSDGFSFSAGIILAALLKEHSVGFAPIRYKSRGKETKVNIAKYTATFIKSYYNIFRNRNL